MVKQVKPAFVITSADKPVKSAKAGEAVKVGKVGKVGEVEEMGNMEKVEEMEYFSHMRLGIAIMFVCLTASVVAQFIEHTEEGFEMMRVYYGGGSFYLDEMQRKALQEWLSSKENLKEHEILLQSHTDNIGTHAYNLYLSQMRGESVIQALNEINIAREEIRIEDFGEDDPTFDNNTWQGRLNNRRVDIILVPPSS